MRTAKWSSKLARQRTNSNHPRGDRGPPALFFAEQFVGGRVMRALLFDCVPMTVRKCDIPLNSRLTAFVSRETGAAELQVSPSTWDEMEKCGQLPKPHFLGANKDIKRWLWAEVVARIVGEEIAGEQQSEPFFRGLASGTTKERKRETAA
jgi:hypothetical protein